MKQLTLLTSFSKRVYDVNCFSFSKNKTFYKPNILFQKIKIIIMKHTKLYLSILFNLICIIAVSAQSYLNTKVDLVSYDSCNNRVHIEYTDEGQGLMYPSAINHFTYELVLKITHPVNPGFPTFVPVDEINYWAKQNQDWGGLVGTKTYNIALPDALACESMVIEVEVNIKNTMINVGCNDVAVDIYYQGNYVDSGYANYCLHNQTATIGFDFPIATVTNNNCISISLSQFGNTISSSVMNSPGLLTYQWSTPKRGGGVIAGSTTGPSITIEETGVFCLTVSNQNGASCTQCINISAMLGLGF